MKIKQLKQAVRREVEHLRADIGEISRYLYEHPELGFQEHLASRHLVDFLVREGFEVQTGLAGLETAFIARDPRSTANAPCVALLAEYDALPKIGHGCGHNLIAAGAAGAAAALRRVLDPAETRLVLLGTPAEEGGGGKVILAGGGAFDGVDAAMMFHPAQDNAPGKDMLGRIKFRVEVHGKSAHAAYEPDQGINALEAMLLGFHAVNALRERMRGEGRIHGIITHGGEAPNIIPDYAKALFYVRASKSDYRDQLYEMVANCFRSAAQALGATCSVEVAGPRLDPFRRNSALETAAAENMTALELAPDPDDGRRFSSDIGNISRRLPTIHPNVAIVDGDTAIHSTDFARATVAPRGREVLLKATTLLAWCAIDYFTSPELRKRAKQAFEAAVENQP